MRIANLLVVLVTCGCAVDRLHRRPSGSRAPLPVSALPGEIAAPAGRVSVHAGPKDGPWRTLYIVNRTEAPLPVTLQDGALPAVLEAQQPDGSFADVSVWRWSTCGNSYAKSKLAPEHFIQRVVRVPQDGIEATLRVRVLSAKVPSSTAFAGVYSRDEAVWARYQRAQLREMPFEALANLLLGRTVPDVTARTFSSIRWDVFGVLRKKHRKDPRLPGVLVELIGLPADAVSGRMAVRALSHICSRDEARPLFARIAAEPDFPRRRGLIDRLFCQEASEMLHGILERPDDPDLARAVKRLDRALQTRYSPSTVTALERFARNEAMPGRLRDRVRRRLATHGRDQLRVSGGLSAAHYRAELDLRTERPIHGCVALKDRWVRTPCARYAIWSAKGWVARQSGPEGRHPLGPGPQTIRLEGIALPKAAELGLYCVEVTPLVTVEGLETPVHRTVLRRESRPTRGGRSRPSWTFERAPCPFPKPPE